VNQDSRQSSWLKWIKQLFRSLSSDSSQFTPEEKKISQIFHVAASLSILILWWALFQLFYVNSLARYQRWQLCENNRSPANSTQISLPQQKDQFNGMIEALGTKVTPSQKIRLRQQIAAIIHIIDSACQERLYFASQRMALGLLGTLAAIVLTVTFGLSSTKGIQQSNRLTLNLGGTALVVLTTAVYVSTFFNDSSNLPHTINLYLNARTLLNTFATELVNPNFFLATPAKLEAWMKAKDQAINPLLVIRLKVDDTLMDQTLTQYLPNTANPPLPAAPAAQP